MEKRKKIEIVNHNIRGDFFEVGMRFGAGFALGALCVFACLFLFVGTIGFLLSPLLSSTH